MQTNQTKLVDHVVSLELAQQLKTVGYPQDTWFIWVWDRGLWLLRERTYLHIMPSDIEWCAAPLASELGEQLQNSKMIVEKGTASYVSIESGGGGIQFCAKSEADARAKLWLYLKSEGLL